MLLFPGQGAQKVGMLAPYEGVPGVAELFATAAEVLGWDAWALCMHGPEEKLNDTLYSQPCVLLCSLAAALKLARDDPDAVARASACAGFSLGEYTALVSRGALDLRSALELLKARGAAMARAAALEPTGMMTVVGRDDAELAPLCAAHACTVANQLFPKGRVVAGRVADLAALERAVAATGKSGLRHRRAEGERRLPLAVHGARGGELRARSTPRACSRPTAVLPNVTAKPHDADADAVRDALVAQLTAGVRWEDTVRDALAARAVEAFYEPAPGAQLKSMMKRIDADAWKTVAASERERATRRVRRRKTVRGVGRERAPRRV